MKRQAIKKSCVGMALLLTLGMFPGSVLAEELPADTSQTVIEASEMQPGDVVTEVVVEEEGLLQVNSVDSAFTPRLEAPDEDNPYYYEYNSYYLGGYGMPNCTAYAYGRAYEILGSRPSLCMGNANQWWDYNLDRGYYDYGSTPKVGAVICWGGSDCGHVAVVEKIEGDKVTYSESTWSGVYFQTRTFTAGNEENTSVGDFQGYIYLGDFSSDGSSEDEADNSGESSDDTRNVITDTTPPVISNLAITNMDASGFTVSCQVADAESGIDKVQFPVWTQMNGQDDLIWYAADVENGVATKRITYTNHNNERDAYNIHVYAYNGAGLAAVTGTSVTVDGADATPPVISDLAITNVDDSGFTVSCQVADAESGIDRVEFPVWTQKDGQDDLVWYTAAVANGVATKRITYANHNNERDAYNVHVYAYNEAGLLAVTGTSVTVPVKMADSSSGADTTPPVISNLEVTNVDDSGFTVSCQVADDKSGIDKVQFPVWTQKDDQDDLIWYTAAVENGVATKRIAYADHNDERGAYNIHVYAYNSVGLLAVTGTSVTVAVDVSYQTHVQNYGWQTPVSNGAVSGTEGQSLRLEAIKINLDDKGYDLGVSYATHVQNIGWLPSVRDGRISGTEGQSLRLEAITMQLTGSDADRFDIYYRVHAQNIGWMGWAKNGEKAGTQGLSYRLEAIQIEIVEKGGAAPGSTENCFVINN